MVLFRGLLLAWALPVAALAQSVASSAQASRPATPKSGRAAAAVAAVPAAAGSVAAARAAAPGATLTVRGVVLNGRELGPVRYLQNQGSGGLALLGTGVPGFAQLACGDSIEVRGVLKNEKGLLALSPIFVLRKLGTQLPKARRVPAAKMVAALSEANEGQLLHITGVSKLSVAGAGAETGLALSAESIYQLDGRPGAELRIPAASTGPEGLVDLRAPSSGPFDVVGIVSQLVEPGGSPTGGYFLLPRSRADIRREGGLPRLLEEPVPTVITPTSLTLTFETLNAGDTRVSYGYNTTVMRMGARDNALTTRHTATIENLRPGTSYYVEVSSTNEAGTVKSPPVLMITKQLK